MEFVVDYHNIEMDEERLRVIQEIHAPRNRKGVLKLAGLFNYYVRFIPGQLVS